MRMPFEKSDTEVRRLTEVLGVDKLRQYSFTAPVASSAGPMNTTAPSEIAPEPHDGAQPLSSEELARPFALDRPATEIDEDVAAPPEFLVGQERRLQDLKRQLSEQEERAADLERQYAEARAESIVRHRQLRKQTHWAAGLEGLAQLKLRLVASGLVALRSALKNLRAYLLTSGAFRWQQKSLVLELQKARKELRKAQEAVSDIEAVLHNLEDERVGQCSRIDGLNRLIAEQEAIIVRDQHFEEQPLVRLARSYRRDPWWPELQSLLKISMLHSETLYLLRSLAARTKDAIIEVGPYIGGSTIALGRGLQMGGGGPLISVEMGGSYPSHAVPTNDIITDLKSNVEAYGLTGVVHIIEGFTTDAAVDIAVNCILDGRPIGLLFLDADGNVERDFELYRGRLSRGSILVYDDYLTEQAPEKQTTIKAWVDQAVASGFVESLGLYRWGTWVGRYWG
jgi:predicted O-methyltransferase YrrM